MSAGFEAPGFEAGVFDGAVVELEPQPTNATMPKNATRRRSRRIENLQGKGNGSDKNLINEIGPE